MSEIQEPPTGCMEIAGFILVIEEGKSWLTKDGVSTTNFNERGIWDTPEEAEAARELLCTYLPINIYSIPKKFFLKAC